VVPFISSCCISFYNEPQLTKLTYRGKLKNERAYRDSDLWRLELRSIGCLCMRRTVTLEDVAKLSGVSMATVSRVVNGKKNVS
jgi:hypothetical protein